MGRWGARYAEGMRITGLLAGVILSAATATGVSRADVQAAGGTMGELYVPLSALRAVLPYQAGRAPGGMRLNGHAVSVLSGQRSVLLDGQMTTLWSAPVVVGREPVLPASLLRQLGCVATVSYERPRDTLEFLCTVAGRSALVSLPVVVP